MLHVACDLCCCVLALYICWPAAAGRCVSSVGKRRESLFVDPHQIFSTSWYCKYTFPSATFATHVTTAAPTPERVTTYGDALQVGSILSCCALPLIPPSQHLPCIYGILLCYLYNIWRRETRDAGQDQQQKARPPSFLFSMTRSNPSFYFAPPLSLCVQVPPLRTTRSQRHIHLHS